jgi:hypothetical protein
MRWDRALAMCLDWRVIAALIAVVIVVAIAAPGAIVDALPVLVVAACPLSMLVMARTMSRRAVSAPGDEEDLQLGGGHREGTS